MYDHDIAVLEHVRATRANQVETDLCTIASSEQVSGCLCVRSADIRGCRVANVIARADKAIGAVEEEVDALLCPVEGWCLDQRAIENVSIQDFVRLADLVDAVGCVNFL